MFIIPYKPLFIPHLQSVYAHFHNIYTKELESKDAGRYNQNPILKMFLIFVRFLEARVQRVYGSG